MKKILAILALTTVAASANMTGFYVGVAGVTGATTAKYTESANSNVPAPNADFTGPRFNQDTGRSIFGGRVEAGYGMTFAGCGWFGVSVYTTLLNTKMTMMDTSGGATADLSFGKATLTNKYNYGVEVKLGYHFTKDTVGFIGVAAEAGKYKVEWAGQSASADNSFAPKLSASKTKVYVKPVIGVRTTGLGGNRNLFLEAKYGYGFANRIRLNVAQDANLTFAGAGTNGRTVTARPRTHEFSVTLGWRF